jgi:TolB-like protein/DNA-binding winged helix-turn-helix (wHTH) protein
MQGASMDLSTADQAPIAFGPFVLDPVHRKLFRQVAPDGTEPIKLGSRQFDTLLYLVQNAGRVVEKDELIAAVWGGRIIEENNLSQAVFGLRRALDGAAGDTYIATEPGRGYRFAAPTTRASLHTPPPLSLPAPASTVPASPVPASPVQAPPAAVPGWHRGRPRLAIAAAASAILLAWVLWHWNARRAPDTAFNPPPHSVAVLAFTNMSGDRGQDYFADGLSEELIGALSRVDGLNVAARTSSFSFKGRPVTVADIARALNVGAVLEGSVRRDGQRVRVTAELTDARTGFQFWSRNYDRTFADILKLQTDVANAVVQALTPALVADDLARLNAGGTPNAQAYDAYLRGMRLMKDESETASRAALAEFDTAAGLDPNYAAAQAQRARMLAYIAHNTDTNDLTMVRNTVAQALDAGDRAVALAPEYGPAHTGRGLALEMMLDATGAEAEMQRGHVLAPGSPDADLSYAYLEAALGHAQTAETLARHAVARDPLSAFAYMQLIEVLFFNRNYADMPAAMQHIVALGGGSALEAAQYYQAFADLAQGQYAAAAQLCGKQPFNDGAPCLAIANRKLGQRDQADALLAKFRAESGDNGAYSDAQIYAQWGDTDQALHWLEAALHNRDPALLGLRTDPMLDPLRGEARFRAVERTLDFPA